MFSQFDTNNKCTSYIVWLFMPLPPIVLIYLPPLHFFSCPLLLLGCSCSSSFASLLVFHPLFSILSSFMPFLPLHFFQYHNRVNAGIHFLLLYLYLFIIKIHSVNYPIKINNKGRQFYIKYL